jgi:stage IV sporulation protein FB
MRLSRVKATEIAARIGQVFAALFVLVGLLGNPILILIGIFVWIAAAAESRQVTEQSMARGRRAGEAMVRRFEALAPDATADDAARLLLATTQQEFPVVDGAGGFRGMVTRKALVEAVKKDGTSAPVDGFMDTDVATVPESAPLEEVMQTLARSPSRTVAVAGSDGRFAGYVSLENLSELFMLTDARGGEGGARSGDGPPPVAAGRPSHG